MKSGNRDSIKYCREKVTRADSQLREKTRLPESNCSVFDRDTLQALRWSPPESLERFHCGVAVSRRRDASHSRRHVSREKRRAARSPAAAAAVLPTCDIAQINWDRPESYATPEVTAR